MATMRDVANRVGVGIATVSRVINRSGPVSETTRKKVQEALEHFHYFPSSPARSLVTGQTKLIALLVPDVTNPFFAEVLRGAEDKAHQMGYNIILCNSEEKIDKEIEYFSSLQHNMVAGYLISAARHRADHVITLSKSVAAVFVDRRIKGIELDAVVIDNIFGAYLGAKYLIELGHKRVGLVTGKMDILPGKERLQGYKKCLKEFGIPIKKELIKSGKFTKRGGYDAALSLLNMKPPPTALFSCSNMMTVGVLTALKEKGITVPDDISLVGFDDLELAPFLDPPLTVVTQPGYNMGTIATDLLIHRIRQKERVIPQEVILKPTLIVRKSCRKLHKN